MLDVISKEENDFEYSAIIWLNNLSKDSDYINIVNRCLSKHLNVIFYGPPGTGKTYNIDNEALKIIDLAKYIELQEDRKKFMMKLLNARWIIKTNSYRCYV